MPRKIGPQRKEKGRSARCFEMLRDASEAASQHRELIEALTCAHRLQFQRRDWISIASTPELPEAENTGEHEKYAQVAFITYKPSWLAQKTGFAKRRLAKLKAAIPTAHDKDRHVFQLQKTKINSHNEEIHFAKSLIAGESAAITKAIDKHGSLTNLPFSVEDVDIVATEDSRVILLVDGLDLEEMPDQSITLLQSGKASIKAMPKGQFYELHRDNICSAALRVALEGLQILPFPEIEVIMHTDLLDQGTGHIRAEPVLYVRVAAQAIGAVNLQKAEPYALIERLGGVLDWNKRSGFKAIDLSTLNIPGEIEEFA